MDSKQSEVNADSSTAKTGEVDGAPSHQSEDNAKPPASTDTRENAGQISEDARKRILDVFENAADDDDGHTEQEEGGQDDDDDGIDESGDQGADDQQEAGDITDSDLDEIEETISDEKRNKAFARMRRENRERQAKLAELEPLADVGRKVQSALERFEGSQDDLAAALKAIEATKTDPIRAIKALQAQIDAAAAAARDEFGDEVVQQVLKSKPVAKQKADDDWREKHPSLAEAVDLGAMEEEEALEYVQMRESAKKPEAKQEKREQKADDDAPGFDRSYYERSGKMLLDLGFYEGVTDNEDRQRMISEELLPAVEKIVERYGLNPDDPDAVFNATRDAAERIVASRAKSQRKRPSRGPLAKRDGTNRERGDGGKNREQVRKEILSGFK